MFVINLKNESLIFLKSNLTNLSLYQRFFFFREYLCYLVIISDFLIKIV